MSLSKSPPKRQKLGGYVRLAIPERREAVRELAAQGMSTRQIGEALGVDHATAARDVNAVANATADSEDESETVANATTPAERPPWLRVFNVWNFAGAEKGYGTRGPRTSCWGGCWRGR